MSIEAMIRSPKGTRATIRRVTVSRQVPGDGSAQKSWSDVATNVPVLLEPVSSDRAQRIFGRETAVTLVGYAIFGQDIKEDDGLVVTGTILNGKKYQVRAALPRVIGPKHLVLGLEDTKETF